MSRTFDLFKRTGFHTDWSDRGSKQEIRQSIEYLIDIFNNYAFFENERGNIFELIYEVITKHKTIFGLSLICA